MAPMLHMASASFNIQPHTFHLLSELYSQIVVEQFHLTIVSTAATVSVLAFAQQFALHLQKLEQVTDNLYSPLITPNISICSSSCFLSPSSSPSFTHVIPILTCSGRAQGNSSASSSSAASGSSSSSNGGRNPNGNRNGISGSNGGSSGSGGDDGEDRRPRASSHSSDYIKARKRHSVAEADDDDEDESNKLSGTSGKNDDDHQHHVSGDDEDEYEDEEDAHHQVTAEEAAALAALEEAKLVDKMRKANLNGAASSSTNSSAASHSPPKGKSHPADSASATFRDPIAMRKLVLPSNDSNANSATQPPMVVGPLFVEPWGGWAGLTDWALLRVRSSSYLSTGEKIDAHPPAFQLEHCEIYHHDDKVYHYADREDSYVNVWWRRKADKEGSAVSPSSASTAAPLSASSSSSSSSTAASPSPSPSILQDHEALSDSSASPADDVRRQLRPDDPSFLFVVHFLVSSAPVYHLTCYFRRKQNEKEPEMKLTTEQEKILSKADLNINPLPSSSSLPASNPDSSRSSMNAFNTLFNRFLVSTDEARNHRLKLLPYIAVGGNWLVRRTVGNRPAIIGNKLTTTYYHNVEKNYLEVDIDVTSSTIGTTIFRVMRGWTKYMVVDMALLIEGQNDDELPERLIGGVRQAYIDMAGTSHIDSRKPFTVSKKEKQQRKVQQNSE